MRQFRVLSFAVVSRIYMRIALIADIHGNLPALEEVLRDAKARGVVQIWALGDLVGYCMYPEETVAMLRKEQVKSIAGNYDTKILAFKKKKSKWKKKKDPVKFFSLRWTYEQLSQDSKEYLKNLPDRLALKEEGKKFLFVHGTTDAADEPLTPDTPDKRFSELAAPARKADADAVLCAHSHLFFDKHADGVRFINPGSVGRPFDNDPRASYAILDITEKDLTVSNIRISYDKDELIKKMKNEKFPPELLQAVIQGKSLDRIKHEKKPPDRNELMKQVLKLAESCTYDREHSWHVSKIALRLFDNLKTLHGLGNERVLLESAALLHDIGLASIRPALRGRRSGLDNGAKRHHKTARNIILKSKNIPLDREEKTITALIVRYHRSALPKKSHKYYSSLTRVSRDVVDKLSSFLRFADGLDRSHLNLINDFDCEVLPGKVILHVRAKEFSSLDKDFGKKKADLFEKVFKKEAVIDW